MENTHVFGRPESQSGKEGFGFQKPPFTLALTRPAKGSFLSKNPHFPCVPFQEKGDFLTENSLFQEMGIRGPCLGSGQSQCLLGICPEFAQDSLGKCPGPASPFRPKSARKGVKIKFDLAKGFCREKFWAKFAFWRGAVRGECLKAKQLLHGEKGRKTANPHPESTFGWVLIGWALGWLLNTYSSIRGTTANLSASLRCLTKILWEVRGTFKLAQMLICRGQKSRQSWRGGTIPKNTTTRGWPREANFKLGISKRINKRNYLGGGGQTHQGEGGSEVVLLSPPPHPLLASSGSRGQNPSRRILFTKLLSQAIRVVDIGGIRVKKSIFLLLWWWGEVFRTLGIQGLRVGMSRARSGPKSSS